MSTLFTQPTPTPKELPAAPRPPKFRLRPYQVEDADAVIRAWSEGRRGVVCRWATGLGKSLMAAEICRRRTHGRIIVMVDVTALATDLHRTISAHTGYTPALLTGDLRTDWMTNRIVVCTVQSLYAGKGDKRAYKVIDPSKVFTAIVDECETSIAERYSEVIRWFRDGNQELKYVGMSATPFRTDKRGMIELYDHANQEPGILNRDILWSVMDGWLVKPRQAFVRCKLDYSTLKVRKKADGDKDYSDDDLTQLMMSQDEQQWRELAEGIHHFAQGRPSIVVCPNSVEIAKLVAYHLCGAGEKRDDSRAHPIYGEQGQHAHDLIRSFKRNEFPYAVSVNMLYKGFDACNIRNVFMLRKTRSRRIYEQSLGRAVRPLTEIRDELNDAPDAESRRAIIEKSDKPLCVMVDMIGVHPDAKDIGVIDILGAHLPADFRERARKTIQAAGDNEEIDVGEQARQEVQKIKAEERAKAEAAERQARSLVQVKGEFSTEYTDDLGASGGSRAIVSGKKQLAANPRDLWNQLAMYFSDKGRPEKRLARVRANYKEITGDWPPHNWTMDVPYTRVTQNTVSKLKSMMIAYAKRKRT